MNKIIIVAIVAVIIGIGVTASSILMESTEEEIIQVENEIVLEEIVPVVEEVEEIVPVVEEVEEIVPVVETGRSLSVELTESIGLKTP